MAREFARIGTDMPHEERIRALPVGPAWLYDRLLMSRDMSRCAIVAYRLLLWADLAADASEAKVRRWLRVLVDGRLVIVDERYAEVFVRTAIRHDRLLAQPNVVAALVSDYRLIASEQLRLAVLTELRRIWTVLTPDSPERGGWLLAMGHYPQKASGPSRWPVAMTSDALGRLRKAVGQGLLEPMREALQSGAVEAFREGEPGGIPEPFANIAPSSALKGSQNPTANPSENPTVRAHDACAPTFPDPDHNHVPVPSPIALTSSEARPALDVDPATHQEPPQPVDEARRPAGPAPFPADFRDQVAAARKATA